MSGWKTSAALALTLSLALPPLLAGCGKTVGETIDDATITTRVKIALLNELGAIGQRIDIDSFRGVVTLTGTVATAEERDKAISIARRTEGVTDVRSTLQIKP
jgi:osmotically-inducible protein OsmY